MVKPPKDVTSAELAILEQLWEHGAVSAKDLSQLLYGSVSASDIATVQKLITRLEAKECVTRNRDQWPHVFTAAIDRETLINQRLQATADELCNGTLSALLSHLVRSKKFTTRQRDSLRKLLDELDSE